jgi:integrase/recombinase XerD
VTLRRPEVVACIPRAKLRRSVPTVLSGHDVEALLEAVQSPKYRAILMTAYGAGMRIGEVCALQVEDIDNQRMLIRVRGGKTGDRYVMLSPRVLGALRRYWRVERPGGPELFPGRRPGTVLCRNAVAKALGPILDQAALGKHVTPHTLRHYAEFRIMPSGVSDLKDSAAIAGVAVLFARHNQSAFRNASRRSFGRKRRAGRVFTGPVLASAFCFSARSAAR